MHEIEFIIKRNDSLAENIMKNKIEQLFMNTEKGKTNEPHKFVLDLSQRLDLRSLDKHVPLQNFRLYQICH